ncbi:MAG TPA: hypothetical protein DEQ20_11580 [Desulfobulbaceae bacterium]|nr:hypothetical protein [Desulfobulbaceae bacterium]
MLYQKITLISFLLKKRPTSRKVGLFFTPSEKSQPGTFPVKFLLLFALCAQARYIAIPVAVGALPTI